MSRGPETEIIDVTDGASFGRLPPCADPRFDHRSCDYWEDEVRGLKTARPSWWQKGSAPASAPMRGPAPDNPFAPPPDAGPAFNPFARQSAAPASQPLAALDPDGRDDLFAMPAFNPFTPVPRHDPRVGADGPRKLRLLTRGAAVFGSYAKVLMFDGSPAAYAQFGPLSAYPRARQIRELYPRLPRSPLPAVITCVASTAAARGLGMGQRLIGAVIADVAARGFAAIEAYPDLTLGADEASAARPDFWRRCGFALAVDDERYPVMRIELA